MKPDLRGEHILACLSTSPSNDRIIRTAARMAQAFGSRFTALFVETPDFAAASAEDKARLRASQKLAEKLGATIETVYGDDVPFQIAEYARLSGVTRIVLGRSAVTRRHRLGKPTLTEQLLSYAPDIDIHIIPDKSASAAYRPRKSRAGLLKSVLINTAKSVAILAAASALSLFLFERLNFTGASIIMVYILGVLLTSIATSQRVYSLISSVGSVFIFNYLFTEPRFTLAAYETGYPVTFLVMFLTAYITGTLALRYKDQARQSAQVARRTRIQFDASQLISKASSRDEIIEAAAAQLRRLLDRNLVYYDNDGGRLSAPRCFPPDMPAPKDMETETAAARWTLENNHISGATTATMARARFMYLAVRVNERVYGVFGIDAQDDPPDASEHSMLLSILGETALALENEKNAREKEAAAVLAESEQLRANLLRTISHDLRTPLTTISGNADSLLSRGETFDADTRRQIYADIYDDAMWLNNLVENLLYATRIEEGRMTLRQSPELVSDIIEAAMKHVSRTAGRHALTCESGGELMLVKADARLMVQVIVNLLDNAVKYTPEGSRIVVSARRSGGMARIEVADDGPGISDVEKARIFEKFYCGERRIADNRRSLGLGLYLCKVIVEAHGGAIGVSDNAPRGAVFCITLPLEEGPRCE